MIVSIVADRNKGFALGAAAVIQKPVSRHEMYESLVEIGLFPVSPGRALKILVADDDHDAVEEIAESITGLASTVLRAYSGRETIEIAQRELPDLIVLDLLMPEVSGFEVVLELYQHAPTTRIPIVVLTDARISAAERVRLNGSVSAILAKAELDRGRLTTEIRRAMAGREVAT